MKAALHHFGGVIFAPRETFARLLAGEGNPLLPVIAYIVVQLAIVGQALYKSFHLVTEAPQSVLRRLFLDAIWRRGSAHADVAILLVVAFALAVVARWLSPKRVHPKAAIVTAMHLLVPVTVAMAFGLLLKTLEWNFWFLPHSAIDSQAILVRTETGAIGVSWFRFAVKCVVSYGPAFVLLVIALRDLWSDGPPPRSKLYGRGWTTALVLTLLASAASASAIDVANQAARLRPLLPGDRVTEIELAWLKGAEGKGRRFSPATYRGKVLVIDFWASWCAPCRRAIPDLNALQEAFKDDVAVVGVNREPRDRKAARKAYQELAFAFPSALDRRAGTRAGFGEQVGLQSLPTTIVVDRNGIVRKIHLGYTSGETLRAEVEALIAER